MRLTLLSIALITLVGCTTAPPHPAKKPAIKPAPVAQPHSTTPTPPAVSPKPTLIVGSDPASVTPIQSEALPPPAVSKPPFGSDEFNKIKDTYPENPPDVSQVPDATPVSEAPAKYGNKSPYTVLGKTYRVLASAKGFKQTGKASFYGNKFHGLRTSSGEKYNMYAMTAAHRNLPLPSYVRVTNIANGKSVVVKVNDRGPFHSDRVMDLSYSAAAKLEILKAGTGTVRIEAIAPEDFQQAPPTPPAQNTPDAEAPHFFVQVGAFSAKGNATALQNKLADIIYSPVNIVDSEGVHRVHVGPFFSRDDAEKAAGIIQENNLGKPIVVQR